MAGAGTDAAPRCTKGDWEPLLDTASFDAREPQSSPTANTRDRGVAEPAADRGVPPEKGVMAGGSLQPASPRCLGGMPQAMPAKGGMAFGGGVAPLLEMSLHDWDSIRRHIGPDAAACVVDWLLKKRAAAAACWTSGISGTDAAAPAAANCSLSKLFRGDGCLADWTLEVESKRLTRPARGADVGRFSEAKTPANRSYKGGAVYEDAGGGVAARIVPC